MVFLEILTSIWHIIWVILQPEKEENEEMGTKPERQFDREVTILSHLHHRNILQLVTACRNPHVFCIIIEYLSEGSLRSYLHKQEPGSVSLKEFISISLDISQGVEYLHSQGIIHHDLKSENVLFAGDKCIKIIEFGIACDEINCDFLEEDGGTYHWMALEIINHKPHNRKVDVYSFGKVLWEIFTRRVPYEDMIPVQAAFAVVHKALEKESDIGGILGRLEKYELEGAEIKAEIYQKLSEF